MIEQLETPTTTRRSSTLIDLIPPHMHRSRLMQRGGFVIFDGVPGAATCQQLLAEALRLSKTARSSYMPRSDAEEVRGGSPARRFLSAVAGEKQRAFYHDRDLIEFLQQVTGLTLQPSGQSGTYTYYARPGDYLAIHRDIDICDLAVITCLYDGPRTDNEGGRLTFYPQRLTERLSAIRATPEEGAVKVRLKPGQTLVLLGGIVPHAVQPTARGQVRIVSILCYRDTLPLTHTLVAIPAA
jgi:hypothetical protein